MNDLMVHLTKSLAEEIDGVMNYAKMAKMAKAEGKPKIAAMLHDMAEEEFCHAKHLKELVHENHTGAPPANHTEMVNKFNAAKATIDEI